MSSDGGSDATIPEGQGFLFRAANGFLTYARCDHNPKYVAEIIWDKLEGNHPKYILCASEHHQDGGRHLHLLFQLRKQFRTTDPSYFDIGTSHPNIQTARNSRKVRDYILKHPISQYSRGEFCVGPGKPSVRSSEAGWMVKRDERMRSIMATATSRADYISMVKSGFPYDWAFKLQAIEYSATKLFPETDDYVSPWAPDSLRCNETISDWLQKDLYQVDPTAYSLLHPQADARSDLEWLSHVSQTMDTEDGAYTSAVQQGQERPPGRGL